MPSPTAISIAALLTSIAGLALSSYIVWRDRARVLARSYAMSHEESGEYSSVLVKIANAGRRPVTLVYLWGIYEDQSRGGRRLADGGKKLEEGEMHETQFGKFDGMMVNGDDMSDLVDLFLEDSAGRRYKIKHARKNVAAVRKSQHPFGMRTHG